MISLDDFDLLYHRKFHWLYYRTYAYLFDKSLIEDVLQEVWALAYARFDTIRHYDNIDAWLLHVMRLQVLAQAEKATRSRRQQITETVTVWDDFGLLELLPGQFPPRFKKVLVLYYQQGYMVKDIAAMEGCTEGYVRAWLFRARECLRHELSKPRKEECYDHPRILKQADP